jgi:hypothetical protein
MTYVYVVTDIYEGELIEISAFPTFEQAGERFDTIVFGLNEHDSDVTEYETDYEDTRLAVNEAGRVIRVSAPSFGAWVVDQDTADEAIRLTKASRRICEIEAETGHFDASGMEGIEDDMRAMVGDLAESWGLEPLDES